MVERRYFRKHTMSLTRDIEQMKNRHRSFLQEIVTAQGYTITSGVALEKQKDAAAVRKLEDCMKSYVQLEQQIKIHSQALDKLAAKVGTARVSKHIPLIFAPLRELCRLRKSILQRLLSVWWVKWRKEKIKKLSKDIQSIESLDRKCG